MLKIVYVIICNVGYQLMRKGGWDGHSGLGGHNEGRLFPVKSVLKADREGFKAMMNGQI